MEKIRLRRAPMRYSGVDRLDVTVRSAGMLGRHFAPTWAMVTDHKAGRLTNERYTRHYHAILDRLPYAGPWLDELVALGQAHGYQITFVCYCPDGVFCHTRLLIQWLVQYYDELFEDLPLLCSKSSIARGGARPMKIKIKGLTNEVVVAEEIDIELDGKPLAELLSCVTDPEKRERQINCTFATMERIGKSEVVQEYVAGCVSAFAVGLLRGWARAKAEADKQPVWRRAWQLLTDTISLKLHLAEMQLAQQAVAMDTVSIVDPNGDDLPKPKSMAGTVLRVDHECKCVNVDMGPSHDDTSLPYSLLCKEGIDGPELRPGDKLSWFEDETEQWYGFTLVVAEGTLEDIATRRA